MASTRGRGKHRHEFHNKPIRDIWHLLVDGGNIVTSFTTDLLEIHGIYSWKRMTSSLASHQIHQRSYASTRGRGKHHIVTKLTTKPSEIHGNGKNIITSFTTDPSEIHRIYSWRRMTSWQRDAMHLVLDEGNIINSFTIYPPQPSISESERLHSEKRKTLWRCSSRAACAHRFIFVFIFVRLRSRSSGTDQGSHAPVERRSICTVNCNNDCYG